MNDSIIIRGVLLIVYMFIVVMAYFVLSTPFEMIVTDMENINASGDAQIESTGGLIRTAFDMAFALAGIIPSFWFIAWCFSREPQWGYR